MKNMQEMTVRNQNAANNPMGPGMAGQFGTNVMGPGSFATGMGMNPMMMGNPAN